MGNKLRKSIKKHDVKKFIVNLHPGSREKTRSYKHENILLVNGYVRLIENSLTGQHIPAELNQICFNFYYSTLQMDSSILTFEEKQVFLNMIAEYNNNKSNYVLTYEWKLLYRGSRDGFRYHDFHQRCDHIPNTLSIIHADTNNVFGGFTSKKWDINTRWNIDADAFLVLLRSSMDKKLGIFKIKNNKKQSATYNCDCRLCWFGWDLIVYDNCNKYSDSVAETTYYNIPEKDYLNPTKKFKVTDIEVFAFANPLH